MSDNLINTTVKTSVTEREEKSTNSKSLIKNLDLVTWHCYCILPLSDDCFAQHLSVVRQLSD